MSIVANTLETLALGEPVIHENLAMFPLLGGKPGDPPYHTLREALDAGTVEVTEVSEGGSVPRLALANRGDKPVLVVDGEELVGAKQNRVLNITILAPAGKTTVLPEDLRFQSKTLSGGALSADGVLLHLCAFKQAQASSRPADDGGTIHRRTGGRNHIIE